jgi:Flp pilus assembly protein TadG
MILSITKPNNSENGASVVEFALVLPLLLIFLFGIIEFGIILFDQAILTNASREGARAGIVLPTPSRLSEAEIATIVSNYCGDHLITFGSAPSPPITTVTFPAVTTFGNDLTVTVEFVYDFLLVPSFIPALPQTLTLRTESVMKYE